MILGGLQKLTLLDFPAHTACTVFTKGCNIRCPFCHNVDLLTKISNENDISLDDFFRYLDERKGKLEGVCITGGEPLLNDENELKDFLKNIRMKGYLIKLDTNGTYSNKLLNIINEKLVDYVAMDIKSGRDKYLSTCGMEKIDPTNQKLLIDNVMTSIDILINSNVDYEFRTTMIKGIHEDSDFYDIKEMIKGAKKYYLQNYHHVEGMPDLSYGSFLKEEAEHFKSIVEGSVKKCELRGIDG